MSIKKFKTYNAFVSMLISLQGYKSVNVCGVMHVLMMYPCVQRSASCHETCCHPVEHRTAGKVCSM